MAVADSKANDGIKAGEGHDPSIHEENTRDYETRSVGGTEETKGYPTDSKFWLIMLTMTALLILGGLDTNIVATAVPSYGLECEYDIQCSII
ncbi:hypothetical protein N7457_004549 [Penicillium paradoxum]|uniref:uncharacterized protein n=1 Tax=Penicillium paradoxum TaxID=176176 RepID=UPI002546FA09|nr:uncharacterized protein N7457_004549 [Penicillium paradoxum]KAJ5782775.1 hypothetical protein N7457_004549 [Penicillium paradoxum]